MFLGLSEVSRPLHLFLVQSNAVVDDICCPGVSEDLVKSINRFLIDRLLYLRNSLG